MAAPTYWTAEMVRALPDDSNRYEVAYGELLVTPSPRLWHEVLVTRLLGQVQEYLRLEPVGIVFGSRADISWADDVLVQPDVFVATVAQVRTLDWSAVRELLLVAEVLSPSSLRVDRFVKRCCYQEVGVLFYWIVDGDERQVEVWTPDARFPAVERERLLWEPAGARQLLVIELEELFRPI